LKQLSEVLILSCSYQGSITPETHCYNSLKFFVSALDF